MAEFQERVYRHVIVVGYLLQEQFPIQPARGEAKVKAGMDMLKQIQDGVVNLLDVIGVDEAISEGVVGEHWPNEQTPDTPRDDGGSTRYFRMDDVRNDYDRRY